MKRILCFLLVMCVVMLSSCTDVNVKDVSKRVVAVSFYPVYIFTLNLLDGIEDIDVRCMAEQNTGCLHDYTLTARDAKLLIDAEVLVINGAGMEKFTQEAWENNTDISVVDSSVGITPICNEEHHEEEHSHKKGEHNHSHTENSHIWLSVKNAQIQTENIKNGLIKTFPEYEEKIESNFQNYLLRLDKLKEQSELCEMLVNKEKVICFHGGFEYIGLETGLCVYKTIESDEGGEPSGKELARLSDEIKNEEIKALFVYPDYQGSSAKILDNETGVKIYTLNPITSGEKSLTAYEDIMSENYNVILKAVK